MYKYNNQEVVLMHHILKHAGVNLYCGRLEKYLKHLQLNKDFFIVPRGEAKRLIYNYNSNNAIFLTRGGVRKIFDKILRDKVTDKRILLTQEKADNALYTMFNKSVPAMSAISIKKEIVSKNIDEHLANLKTNSPLIQLIVEKVADRIMKQISA